VDQEYIRRRAAVLHAVGALAGFGAAAILGVLAFCLVASAVYIINGYWDRAADRLHPEKRHRPLAAQTVTVLVAAGLMLALLGGGARAAALSPTFVDFVRIYFGLNLAYSLGLKGHLDP
jgi:4-hydroxybenzoate polyprenyltransferase